MNHLSSDIWWLEGFPSFSHHCSEVIDGWEILISTMALKEKAELTCPPQYAYGGPAAGGSCGGLWQHVS